MNQKKNKVDKVIAHGSENVDLKYDMWKKTTQMFDVKEESIVIFNTLLVTNFWCIISFFSLLWYESLIGFKFGLLMGYAFLVKKIMYEWCLAISSTIMYNSFLSLAALYMFDVKEESFVGFNTLCPLFASIHCWLLTLMYKKFVLFGIWISYPLSLSLPMWHTLQSMRLSNALFKSLSLIQKHMMLFNFLLTNDL